MFLNQKRLQFLGIHGIFRETISLILTSTTIFSKITLAFILPLFLLIFTLFQTSNLWSIHSLPFNLTLFFFSAVYFFLSTSAAFFSAACTFTDRQITFHHLILVAPKVCKQLLITFLCLIVDFLAFNFIALPAITLIGLAVSCLLIYVPLFDVLIQVLILLLSIEVFYFVLIWQISSVVSVFEAESYGFEAIARSKELVKGKMKMASILLILIGLPFGVILSVLHYVVVESALVRVGILGIVWMCSFMMFLLSGTVLYLVCKLFHRESIDESALCDHIQGYMPIDSEGLKDEDDDEVEKSLVV